jgi:hypothetical protein
MPTERVMLRTPTTALAHGVTHVSQEEPGKSSTGFVAPLAANSGFNFASIGLHSPNESGSPTQHPTLALQRKLEIGAANDPLECEADDTAEHILRMPQPVRDVTMDSSHRLRRCAACEKDEEQHGRLARMSVNPSAILQSVSPPSTVHKVLGPPGQPLDGLARNFLEPRFGYDLGNIRVHTDSTAQDLARAVNARAWTVGKDIAFASGQYAPESHAGRLLLAHELTHSIQQGAVLPKEEPSPFFSAPQLHGNGPQFGKTGMMLQRQVVVDPRKLQIERIVEPRHIRISEWLTEDVPGGGSSLTEIYWADFEVEADGVMQVSVRTVTPDRTFRTGTLRHGKEFRNAIKCFEDAGVEVNAYDADWSYMTADEISENLRTFKEGMAEGLTGEQAASKTPCGRIAGGGGFEVTSVENVLESQEHWAEAGVRRWRAKALFRRTPAPASVSSPQGSPGGKPVTPAGPDAVTEPKVTLEPRPSSVIPETKLRGGAVTAESRVGPTLGEAAVDTVKSFAVGAIVAAVVPGSAEAGPCVALLREKRGIRRGAAFP